MGQKYTKREIGDLMDYRVTYYTYLSQRAFARKVVERSMDPRSSTHIFLGRSFASIYALVRRIDARLKKHGHPAGAGAA